MVNICYRDIYHKYLPLVLVTILSFTAILAGCQSTEFDGEDEIDMTLVVSSTAFSDQEKIPVKYTCDGEDVSPALSWEEPPQGTATFALIVDDPDAPAGIWSHWVIFNIPADTRELAEAISAQEQLTSGAIQGKNDFGRIGYGGPCPPGPDHHYHFTVYALDKSLNLTSSTTREQLLDAMQGSILAQGRLTGIYR